MSETQEATKEPGLLELLVDVQKRLAAVEDDNARMREELARSKETGETAPYPGFGDHVVHVMQKHFFNDVPDGFAEKYREHTIVGDPNRSRFPAPFST